MKIEFPEHFTQNMVSAIKKSKKFKRYVTKLRQNFIVNSIIVTDVVWFGDLNPGFIYVDSEIYDDLGNKIPNCAMLRGDGVGILLVLRNIDDNFKEYTVLVEQGRSPIGSYIKEIPAGVVEDELSIIETAIHEIQEEVDERLILTEDNFLKLFSGPVSPGGIDERIHLVSATVNVTGNYLIELQGKLSGLAIENEHIVVNIVELDNLPNETNDMKSTLAYYKYKFGV